MHSQFIKSISIWNIIFARNLQYFKSTILFFGNINLKWTFLTFWLSLLIYSMNSIFYLKNKKQNHEIFLCMNKNPIHNRKKTWFQLNAPQKVWNALTLLTILLSFKGVVRPKTPFLLMLYSWSHDLHHSHKKRERVF